MHIRVEVLEAISKAPDIVQKWNSTEKIPFSNCIENCLSLKDPLPICAILYFIDMHPTKTKFCIAALWNILFGQIFLVDPKLCWIAA